MSVHRQLDAVQRQLAAIQRRLDDPTSVDGVFVVGCPRSGTSALSWALAQHPALVTGPESNFLYSLASKSVREAFSRGMVHEKGWLKVHGVSYAEFAASIGYGVQTLFASRSLGKRWVDSSTENVLVAGELALMFPRAKFFNVIRDGRAVVCSLLESGFGQAWTKDFATACKTWVEFIEAGERFQRHHKDRMLDVRNETMAEDCDRMLAFLGEDPHPDCSRFLNTSRINSSFGRDGKPVETSGPKWDAWPEELKQLFEEIAGPTLRRLGYGNEG